MLFLTPRFVCGHRSLAKDEVLPGAVKSLSKGQQKSAWKREEVGEEGRGERERCEKQRCEAGAAGVAGFQQNR